MLISEGRAIPLETFFIFYADSATVHSLLLVQSRKLSSSLRDFIVLVLNIEVYQIKFS